MAHLGGGVSVCRPDARTLPHQDEESVRGEVQRLLEGMQGVVALAWVVLRWALLLPQNAERRAFFCWRTGGWLMP